MEMSTRRSASFGVTRIRWLFCGMPMAEISQAPRTMEVPERIALAMRMRASGHRFAKLGLIWNCQLRCQEFLRNFFASF